MKLRDRLFSSFFFRNMLATDYLLYFKKPPTLQAYKNEVFNKMSEYSGFDLAGYLDFHYLAFADKPMFTRAAAHGPL